MFTGRDISRYGIVGVLVICLSFALLSCGGGGGGGGTVGPTAPNAPGTLAATPISNTAINLSWIDSSSNEDGFKIERSVDGSTFSQIALVTANTTTYSDTGRTQSTKYFYRIRASNSAGNSAYSKTVVVSTLPVSLPKTGQTICSDATGTTISCTGTGQDGDHQKGVAWPGTRFVAASSGTGTVFTDMLTGLMWDNGDSATFSTCTGGQMAWQDALIYVACLNSKNYLGHADWRLPNRTEMTSLIDYSQYPVALPAGNPFNFWPDYYWTSTTYPFNTSSAFTIGVTSGNDSQNTKITLSPNYVWPVRTGQVGAVSLPRTGQVVSYATVTTQDDGSLQEGVPSPNPRFSASSSGTGTVVADNLTGLMWAGDGSTPSFSLCTGGTRTWQAGLDYVACLNTQTYLGYADWRMPNKIELESLTTVGFLNSSLCGGGGCSDVAAWLNSQGFTSVMTNYQYWSSTTMEGLRSAAWYVSMMSGMSTGGNLKSSTNNYILPVRGGI